jgi:hypothetical protein
MGLTKEQWDHAAEKAAAEAYGRDHKGWYVFKRYGAAPTAVAAVLAGLGFLGYKLWSAASHALAGDVPMPSPLSLALFAALLIATLIAYRPGRFPLSLPAMLVKAIVFIGAWLMLIATALGAIG